MMALVKSSSLALDHVATETSVEESTAWTSAYAEAIKAGSKKIERNIVNERRLMGWILYPNALKKYDPPFRIQPFTRTSKREKSPKSQLAVKEASISIKMALKVNCSCQIFPSDPRVCDSNLQ
jgi:hypothetical protein